METVHLRLSTRQSVPGMENAPAKTGGERKEDSAREELIRTTIECSAKYRCEGSCHVLRYEERDPDSGEVTHVTMRIAKDQMMIERRGTVSAVMRLIPGQDTLCRYGTPFGVIPMIFRTTKLTVNCVCAAEDAEAGSTAETGGATEAGRRDRSFRLKASALYSILQEGSETVRCAVSVQVDG